MRPTAECCVCRTAWARPDGLPNPTACSTEFQKAPPMVHYFRKDLRLRAKPSLLHFKTAGNGPDRLVCALLGALWQTLPAATNISETEVDGFFTVVLLW